MDCFTGMYMSKKFAVPFNVLLKKGIAKSLKRVYSSFRTNVLGRKETRMASREFVKLTEGIGKAKIVEYLKYLSKTLKNQ